MQRRTSAAGSGGARRCWSQGLWGCLPHDSLIHGILSQRDGWIARLQQAAGACPARALPLGCTIRFAVNLSSVWRNQARGQPRGEALCPLAGLRSQTRPPSRFQADRRGTEGL